MQPKRVTIMGLGVFGGGAGATRYWCQAGAEVTVTDLRSREELAPTLQALEDLSFNLVLGEHPETLFTHTDLVVVNQAVPPSNRFLALAKEHHVPVTTELELVLQHAPGPVLCVTGSNGKSTTTALLHAMIQTTSPHARIGGNIGISLLPDLACMAHGTPIILEVSSFQLEHLSPNFRPPYAAILTNLSPNHLDRHGTAAAYYAAKQRLFSAMPSDGFWVGNADDEAQASWPQSISASCISASLNPSFVLQSRAHDAAAYVESGTAWLRINENVEPLFDLSDVQLVGHHNVMNALQAAAAARRFGVPHLNIQKAIRLFHGLPHRMEFVTAANGITWINDSDATTPESTVAGLHALKGDVIIIAGGVDKGMDFSELGRVITECTRGAILIGRDAEKISTEITRADPTHPQARASTLENAIHEATQHLPNGGTVLFSPACASFDMFANFADRGEAFRKIVLAQRH